ncbi:hypothetical protein MS3_00011177 [Schistosoma haematobium]|uniref:Tetraspanin n=2 Tax=Schistosoma haematobium TaxID=6185 RepID=A0A922LE99_SCHHA|nr:hypothetical protein MS3_00011177 [Schistosoma haematobium]KAH9579364.1 hypothetical protein MS3_00011177 [Schistosoma haematobium]CAH8632285.1 unnamed protein product [Schistosoma haematobium]CAH8639081.1 unnamed protein product [Schistosoma haematobium]
MGVMTVCLHIFISTILMCILSIFVAFIGILKWCDVTFQFIMKSLLLPILKQVNNNADETTIQRLIEHIRSATDHLTLAVFIVTIILLVILCFGMVGICFRSKVIIFIYILLLALSIVLLSVWLITESADPEIINIPIKNQLKLLIANYHSVGSNEADSVILATLMPLLSCCGYFNGEDFEKSRFVRNESYKNMEYPDIHYPVTCCQLDSKFSLRYSSCPNYFTESNSFIQIGCWNKLNDLILLIRHAMILVIVGKIGILLILSGLSSLEIIPRKTTFIYP